MEIDLAKRIYNSLNWKRDVVLLVFCVSSYFGFRLRSDFVECIGEESEGEVLDARKTGYSESDARGYLNKIKPKGRLVYAITQLSLDVVFPLSYASFFAILIVRCLNRRFAFWFVFFPVVAAIADLSENLLTATATWTFDWNSWGLLPIASFFTQVKWILVDSTGVAFLLLLILDWLILKRPETDQYESQSSPLPNSSNLNPTSLSP